MCLLSIRAAPPVFFLGKKHGSLRLVTDREPLNRITTKGGYPVPKIRNLASRLAKAKR